MKKVIRDDRGFPIGWTNTGDKKGTFNEFVDRARYAYMGYIAETLQSLDRDEREYIIDKGKLI